MVLYLVLGECVNGTVAIRKRGVSAINRILNFDRSENDYHGDC